MIFSREQLEEVKKCSISRVYCKTECTMYPECYKIEDLIETLIYSWAENDGLRVTIEDMQYEIDKHMSFHKWVEDNTFSKEEVNKIELAHEKARSEVEL